MFCKKYPNTAAAFSGATLPKAALYHTVLCLSIGWNAGKEADNPIPAH